MKKLIVSAALVCAASFTYGAAVDFSANKVFDAVKTAETGGNVAASGWLGYMILASDYDAVTADLIAGKTDLLVEKHVGPVKKTSSAGKFSASTAEGNVASGEQSFYLIMLNSGTTADATGYAISGKVTKEVDASLDTTIAFGSMEAYTKSADSWATIGNGGGENPPVNPDDPVTPGLPEPTSGVLLAVGAAVMGLRRKRA